MKWNFRVGGMGKNSFRDVVKALFYYEIYKDLSFYIEENPSCYSANYTLQNLSLSVKIKEGTG